VNHALSRRGGLKAYITPSFLLSATIFSGTPQPYKLDTLGLS
jgi:hypothetical protein